MNVDDINFITEIGYEPIASNYGYLIDKVPQEIITELKKPIDELQNDFSLGKKYNYQLAGEIKHEYELDIPPQTKEYIKYLSQVFENESRYMECNFDVETSLEFSKLWVNFQKKHEYNPPHFHNGVYSFVIWYQIPYTFEEEKKYSFKHDLQGGSTNGIFQFLVPTPFNSRQNIAVRNLYMDKSKEGYVAIFPSNLYHCVHPFYSSDEYRITIAGNIQLHK